MTGYTRQSLATLQPGLDIDAEPFNDEFNAIQAAFDNSSGHDHSGLFPGDGAKIALPTAVAGILPVANGGSGVALSTGTTKVVLSNSPTIVTPTIASITGPTTLTTGGLTINTGGLTVVAGGAVITGAFNCVTSVSDGGNRVFSRSNLLSFSAGGQVNPSGTTSNVGRMAGLGYPFTSNKTGRILIIVTGMLSNDTNATQASAILRFGTGLAPVNGAADVGTGAGGLALATITNAGDEFPFTCSSIIAVTIGTAYWIDLLEASPTGVGTARLLNLFFEVVEV